MKKLLTTVAILLALSGASWAQGTETTTATVNVVGSLVLSPIVGTVDFGNADAGDNNVAPLLSGGGLSVPFSDTRGATSDYHLTVQSTDFTSGPTNTIPATGFELETNGANDLVLTPGGGNTNPPPSEVTYAVGQPLDQPVRLVETIDQSLSPTEGKGAWTLEIDSSNVFTLDIPATTPPGAYIATMTFSLNSGSFGP